MANAPHGERHPEQRKHDWFERLTLLTAIVGVIVLCVYTGITAYQAWIARDSERRQLRAYVVIDGKAIAPMNVTEHGRFDFLIHNTGQTPAYDLEYIAGGKVLPYPLPPGVHFNLVIDPKAPTSKSNVGAGQHRDAYAINPALFTEGEIARITDGTKERLYIYGTVYYLDAFTRPHYTNFCLSYGGITIRTANGDFCDQHNDAN